MSAHHLSVVARLRLPDGPKFVLLCLADDAGAQTGIAVPGLEELMAWSGRGRSAVLDAITELVRRGLVERVSTGHRGSRAEFRVLCPCSEHQNGSGQPDPIEAERVRKGSGTADPIDPKGSGKGPERVRELPDPLKPSTSTTSSSPAQPKGTRLPANAVPSEDWLEYARQRGFTATQTNDMWENFRDYWTAKPGAGGVKLDWAATWRTWVRNDAERKGIKPRTAQPAAPSPARDPKAAAAAAKARHDADREAWQADQARQMAILAQMDPQ